MLRKLITACAGVMMTGTAMAADVTGTYAGQANGRDLAVRLEESDGMVRGVVQVGEAELQLAGREENGTVRGVYQGPDGRQYPFAANVEGGQLSLKTINTTYSLERNDPAPEPTARRDVPAFQADPRPNQQGTNPFGGEMKVRMEQGQIFARPVPDGWKSGETCNETFIYSPDGTMGLGFTGLEAITQVTPQQFIELMICQVYKHANLKIVDQHEIQTNLGGRTIEAIISFDRAGDGKPCVSWVRCNVLTFNGSSNGYILFATTSPEKFQAAVPTLIQMAEKIQITDPNAAFDRARRLGVIQSIKNNPIPDTIIVGYNERQKIMEGVSARRGDVATNTYVWTDPSTGQKYTGGQENIDPTAGGVRNPERPTELLEWAKHWQGHLPQ